MPAPEMRAVRFHSQGGPEVLVYEAVPKPTPAHGEVLLRVGVVGVNFSDVARRRGDPYPQLTPLPFIPGGEAIGTVEAVGDPADAALLGRIVYGFPGKGCYAEYVTVATSHLFAVPQGLDVNDAIALFVQGLSASLILGDSAHLQKGETLLIQGAGGGVGLLAVQIARIRGAACILGAASSPAKRDLVRECGAHQVFDSSNDDWVAQAKAFAGPQGIDVVMEMTGGAVAQQCLQLLAPFGRCVIYGVAGQHPLIVDTEQLPGRNLTLRGFYLRPYLTRRAMIEAQLEELARHVREGTLRVHSGGVFPLSAAAEAHRQLESRQAAGKLVLTP